MNNQTVIPPALLTSLQAAPGFAEAAFVQAHAAQAITSIRLNPAKPVEGLLDGFGTAVSPVPWNSHGYYLAERPVFTLDPLLHAGAYYVQEASSMFLQQAVVQCCPQGQPLRALDLCAAPGGKSTLLQSILPPGSLLVSNEVIKSRANILAENITKWGAANVVVTNNDPQHFARLSGFFDLIVVDAPCSGSGLFRRDAAAIDEWSPANVELCSQRQQRILADILPALQPGGTLIYATCSYSPQEDEGIMDWLMGQGGLEGQRITFDTNWGIVETESSGAYGYRFYPDKVQGEGFFIACFTKQGGPTGNGYHGKPKKQDIPSRNEAALAAQWLQNPSDFAFIKQQNDILAIPQPLMADLALLQSTLYLKKAGINMGQPVANGWVPSHELAISGLLPNTLSFVELDKTNALQYLRRDHFAIGDAPQLVGGWCLVRYLGLPLGWIKAMPGRVNNYYPKDWRILMRSE